MIINVVIFQFVVYAAALWSALHGLVGVLDVQICNNMINIQAGYLKYKVNRCLARYSPRAKTTNRPTNRALNKPAWPGPN